MRTTWSLRIRIRIKKLVWSLTVDTVDNTLHICIYLCHYVWERQVGNHDLFPLAHVVGYRGTCACPRDVVLGQQRPLPSRSDTLVFPESSCTTEWQGNGGSSKSGKASVWFSKEWWMVLHQRETRLRLGSSQSGHGKGGSSKNDKATWFFRKCQGMTEVPQRVARQRWLQGHDLVLQRVARYF